MLSMSLLGTRAGVLEHDRLFVVCCCHCCWLFVVVIVVCLLFVVVIDRLRAQLWAFPPVPQFDKTEVSFKFEKPFVCLKHLLLEPWHKLSFTILRHLPRVTTMTTMTTTMLLQQCHCCHCCCRCCQCCCHCFDWLKEFPLFSTTHRSYYTSPGVFTGANANSQPQRQ